MPPNILLFLTDDHAQWALGSNGNHEIHTPTLDYLAQTGVILQNAFTPTPVCSPARACLHTGRLASQHGIHDYLASDDPTINGRFWLTHEQTLGQLLQQAGYETAMIGKWHLGQDEHPHPGYDHWFTLGRGYPILHPGPHDYGYDGQHHTHPGRITHQITQRAQRFLQERNPHKPFFLCVGYYATHSPWVGQAERLAAHYRHATFTDIPQDATYPFGRQNLESTDPTRHTPREALAQYYAAVTEIDTAVGQLLDDLEAHALHTNTYIIYTSDHGLNCGHHGIWGKGNGTLPLNMVEESIRIPLIWHGPGLFANQRRADYVDHLDTFQTLLDIANVPAPPQRNYPGRSYAPLLQNRNLPHPWRTVQFGEYGPTRMIRTPHHKLVCRYPAGPCELFDLQADPRETHNLFHDPAQQPLVAQLTHQLDEHFSHYEEEGKNGRFAHTLPQHNFTEAWRKSDS